MCVCVWYKPSVWEKNNFEPSNSTNEPLNQQFKVQEDFHLQV